MSQGGPAWKRLGLAPTEDQREIRRAYARQLKAIDVERDPQAFIALREAFEDAQHIARWMAYEREEAENPEAEAPDADDMLDEAEMADTIGALRVDLGQAPSPALAAAPAAAERDGPWSPPTPEKFDAHAAALAQLLQRNNLEPRPWPTDAEREEMLVHWRVIQADPRMQQLDFYADAENWIAGLIGFTIPFSDTLIVPATEYFGWVRDEGKISQSNGLSEVVYRYRMLSFLDEIRDPGGQHYEAWCELTTPADVDAERGRVSVKKIHKLLHQVRLHYPGLEGNFEPERVALWDRGNGGDALGPLVPDEKQPIRIPGYLLWFFLVLIAIPAIGNLTKNSSSPTFRPSEEPALLAGTLGLSDEKRDVEVLLKNVGDGTLTLEKIEKQNPKLAQLIRSNWEISHEGGQTLLNFVNNVSAVLNDQVGDRKRIASPETLLAYRTLVADKARALRSISPQKCADFFRGVTVQARDLTPELLKRERAMITRLLLEPGDPAPRSGPTTFMIPNAVFDEGARRAKLSQARMEGGAMNKGTPADICNARIGLTEAVIAMPAGSEKTRLLRAM
ncbi:hypothetical protein P6144_09825 [Sphingomonas sp. HITSZ_GF]|uniref:hypothetical protein n=1 Tax=Sphingomonas sp. HITSZ_GF TaxID=3037247 RepID=UPI00240E0D0B|nr:hypothetical protein [Sphingomonas sp. HITSZ_GF]MDG2533944.1 hypothetical protein [Sphingomonas sp. HITSZ_GF]